MNLDKVQYFSILSLVTGLALVGACMRVLSTNEIVFITAAHSCAVLNGILSVLVSALSPAISSAWFKENERTTATCISIVCMSYSNNCVGLNEIEIKNCKVLRSFI